MVNPNPIEEQTNQRYVAYARSLGETPAQAFERDAKRYPGGRMCGFILWVNERWREFDKTQGNGREHVRSKEEHAAFDRWLASVFNVETAESEHEAPVKTWSCEDCGGSGEIAVFSREFGPDTKSCSCGGEDHDPCDVDPYDRDTNSEDNPDCLVSALQLNA